MIYKWSPRMSQHQIMNNGELDKKIEALLFWKGEELQVSFIAKVCEVSESETLESLERIKTSLENRGFVLIQKDNRAMLRTHPDLAPLFEKLTEDELTKELSKAALETLTIVLYRGPIKRNDIDFIRGVNSQFILRTLSIRGLIEKIVNPQDERGFLYRPTFELLSYLGVRSIDELPDFESVKNDIESFMNSSVDKDLEN